MFSRSLIVVTSWEIDRAIERGRKRGLLKAGKYLVAKIKRVLSTPAERRLALRPRERTIATRRITAATRATPGAPPRKLSGTLRASIAMTVNSDGSISVGTDKIYAGALEFGQHPYLFATAERELPNMVQIITDEIAAELKRLES
jgi:hypothetical protein